MYKKVFLLILVLFILGGCSSKINIFNNDELKDKVANKNKIINHLEGNILNLTIYPNTEKLVVFLPKDNLTLRIKLKVPNIEDVLYLKIISNDEFNINKIIRRVEKIDKLDLNQDGFMFEPSKEKDVITLQLYMPMIYLYKSKYNLTLDYAFKRENRSIKDTISFVFIRQKYYPTLDKNGYEIPKYATLKQYCKDSKQDLSIEFYNQIDMLNSNRVDEKLKNKLRGLCR